MEIVEILKTLGDENRLRILNLLHNKGKLCVCEIESTLNLNQSNVSRHISRLKKEKIIIGEKRSQWVDYYINERFFEKYPFVKLILEGELKKKTFIEDLEKINSSSVKCK